MINQAGRSGEEAKLYKRNTREIWQLLRYISILSMVFFPVSLSEAEGRDPEIYDEQKLTERAPQEPGDEYRHILLSLEEGYYEADLAGNITFCNDAAGRLLGCSRQELLGVNYKQLARNPESAYRAFHQVYLTGRPQRFTMELIQKDGATVYGELSISPIKGEGGITGFRGVARDITERIIFEEQLRHLSLYDQLTGLYNRAFFEEEIKRFSTGREYPISLISADMDNLKLINDTMGHDKGDQLLIAVAGVLKGSLRGSDILARVGGDEFCIILPRTDAQTAAAIAARIKENIAGYNLKQANLLLGLSLGVATAETKETALKELYQKADDMMYREKLYHSATVRSRTVQALLETLAKKDFINEGHGRRLEQLCQKIGEKINLSTNRLTNLALLARVHDLGKVSIPDRILFKTEPLTAEEWHMICQHPEKGYRIALSSTDLSGVADFILKHHEWWDGSGYPLGIKGKEIPVESRILAIVDAYDAMTSGRPYSKARPHESAIEELKQFASTQFDPELVDLFLDLFKYLIKMSFNHRWPVRIHGG